ncbi:MAG: thiamine phosphate synthase [Verrucomicrobiota bacterium]
MPDESGAPISAAVLYAILDLGYVKPARLEETTRCLIAGGADLLQLRAKGCSSEEILGFGRRIQPLCREANIPFIVNDHSELARELGADGLHLGQDDGSLEEARRVVGPEMILGRSTHSLEQARAALAEGFDYIGFGPLFPTPTKFGRPGIGMECIAAVEKEVGSSIPVFCIGGIKRRNLPEVIASGARRVVIVSDLLRSPDITTATREARAICQGV